MFVLERGREREGERDGERERERERERMMKAGRNLGLYEIFCLHCIMINH